MADEREEELEAINAIYPEIVLSSTNDFTATLDIPINPTSPVLIRFLAEEPKLVFMIQQHAPCAQVEHDIQFNHLPPLKLHIQLPPDYPELGPPKITLTTAYDWLPHALILELQAAVATLWEEYGRCQILFAYIDHLQQCAEHGLMLDSTSDGPMVLSMQLEHILREFDRKMTQSMFDSGTYYCGICLEPKKGRSCYKLENCGHVFCKQCFQDFYNNAITEGDITTVRCLDPDCGKHSKSKKRSLRPRELLAIGLDEPMVRRYVEMKRKKKLESDKTTVYCPRTWCQHPARSAKYPPIPANLLDYPDLSDAEEEQVEEEIDSKPVGIPALPRPSNNDERLAICEKCQFAFCKTCSASWHGSFVRCYPKDSTELTAEDKASYEYIMLHTSPCPTCSSPISKTMGCNHMHCYQCQSHFCYLCGFWLNKDNPYEHFNTQGTSCYQRLWELEEGDDGQAPADGQGFGGARALEAMAIEAAREADREEAEAAAAQAANATGNPPLANVAAQPVAGANAGDIAALGNGVMQIQIEVDATNAPQRRAAPRRQRNPFPAHPPARGVAAAVRAHERQPPARRQRPVQPPVDDDQHREDEMRRFIELALRDEEDGWNSDEFAEDDAAWHIR